MWLTDASPLFGHHALLIDDNVQTLSRLDPNWHKNLLTLTAALKPLVDAGQVGGAPSRIVSSDDCSDLYSAHSL